MRLAVDCMGGDHGVTVTVPACIHFLSLHPDASVLLVGREDAIKAELETKRSSLPVNGMQRIKVIHAPDVVAMDEPPAQALRNKRASSIHVAAKLVKDGEADALVSAGNTGALMAISRYVLKTLSGIERPAIASLMPNQRGSATTVLDLGANVDCTAEHLLQFALMGAALVTAVEGVERPSVGLLNIGEEAIKGNEVVKEAADLLRASALNFFGNVEGNDIFKGTTAVVVCDGFVGNIVLKASEGLAQMLGGMIKQEFSRNLFSKVLAAIASPVLLRFRRRVDHRRYNGACLLGLRGIVFKSHGSADGYAFGFALARAHEAAKADLLKRIERSLVPHLHPVSVEAGQP